MIPEREKARVGGDGWGHKPAERMRSGDGYRAQGQLGPRSTDTLWGALWNVLQSWVPVSLSWDIGPAPAAPGVEGWVFLSPGTPGLPCTRAKPAPGTPEKTSPSSQRCSDRNGGCRRKRPAALWVSSSGQWGPGQGVACAVWI